MSKKNKHPSNHSVYIIALVSFAIAFLAVWLLIAQFQTEILQLIIG